MWASIIAALAALADKLFGFFKDKREEKIQEKKDANTEQEKAKEEILQEIKIKDDGEKLIREIQHAQTDEQKERLLADLRRRVS